MADGQHSASTAPLRLEDHHGAILHALDEIKARRTGQVSAETILTGGVDGTSHRVASANCRQWLLELEAAGLAARADDRDPAAWLRTATGTAMLGLMR